METVYVKSPSKAAFNRAMVAGDEVEGFSYSPWGVERVVFSKHSTDQTEWVMKFWSKKDPTGRPIAKSYGTWNPKKGRAT